MSLKAQPALEPRMKMRRMSGVNGKRGESPKDLLESFGINQGGTAESHCHLVPCRKDRDLDDFFYRKIYL